MNGSTQIQQSRSAYSALLVASVWLLLHPTAAEAQGTGVGIKAGTLRTNLNLIDGTDVLDDGTGWMGGLFFGGNRTGRVGFMGELNVLAKRGEFSEEDSTIYYAQIPAMLRVNLGSRSRGFRSAIVYGIVGPAIDLKIGQDLSAFANLDNLKAFDLSAVAGVGIEVARFIVEARMNWGLRNIVPHASATELRTRSFALLGGIRFN